MSPRTKKLFKILFLTFLLLMISTCNNEKPVLRLATTTSTVGSGLLDELIPVFEEISEYKVEILSKGTGASLQLARDGGADVVLVHARIEEDLFISEGFGVNRRDVMYNDFVLLGPAEDPAGISGGRDVDEALKKILESQSPFYSRGDNSGTHLREQLLWGNAGIFPHSDHYYLSGKGMLDTLKEADQMGAYVLSDRSTYLFNRQSLNLLIHVEGDSELFNPYGIIAVNPLMVEEVNFEGAMALIDFITSKEGQEIIGKYGTDRFGQPLFIPMSD